MKNLNSKIIVIGGGPAGMMAATTAKENTDNQVILVESNEKLGKKLYITGKGRCNVTSDSDTTSFISSVVSNPKFMLSAINNFSCQDTVEYFTSKNVPLKLERGGRYFPQSDKSSDIIKALEKHARNVGVEILLNSKVEKIIAKEGKIFGVIVDKAEIDCDCVVLATGGVSYPATGSDGNGYVLAKQTGHTVIEPRPALVPIILQGDEPKLLQGLSLKNVTASVCIGDKTIVKSQLGEMLFTSNGVSGPIILTISSKINREALKYAILSIDLKPAITIEQLDARLLRDFNLNINKQLRNAFDGLLPKSLIPVFVDRLKIDKFKPVHSVTAVERRQIAAMLKDFKFVINRLDDIERGIITAGGISTKEINPSNMASRFVKGLYFAGEVIDVDAVTGGYNIQIALSTGYLAGQSVKKYLNI